MIKNTFYNLPEHKKNRIINVCIDELANNKYEKVSITKICKKADIPKGSFYQYFDNKFDIIVLIMDIIAKKKMQYIDAEIFQKADAGFFELYNSLFKAGIKFSLENIELYKAGISILKSGRDIIEMIEKKYNNKTQEYLTLLVKRGIEKKELNEDLGIEFITFYIQSIQNSYRDYFLELLYKGTDFSDPEIFNDLSKKFLTLLKKGLGI